MRFKLGLTFMLALAVGFTSLAILPGCGGDEPTPVGGEGPDPAEELTEEQEQAEEELNP